MQLSRDAIQRMIGQPQLVGTVQTGGGGDSGAGNYVSKDYFNMLFEVHGNVLIEEKFPGDTDWTVLSTEDITFPPNEILSENPEITVTEDEQTHVLTRVTRTITDIEVKDIGLWTEKYISALGQNSSGGGGGGGTGDVTWQALKDANPDITQRYITWPYISAAVGEQNFATQTWVGQQGFATQTWVNSQNFLTGINASMINTALGFTITGTAGASYNLSDFMTQTAADNRYLTIAFFSSLFKAYTSGNAEVTPNAGDTSTIDNIKAMFGFWTEQYISALGQNSSGGGGGGTGDVTWTALADNTDTRPISWSHISAAVGAQNYLTSSALTGYATQTWVNSQNFLTGITASMINTALGFAITGTAGASYNLGDFMTQTAADNRYLTISFFSSLFKAYTSGNAEVTPNAGDTSTIDNIKAMFGFWTEQYISALGQNSSGGGGGGTGDVTWTALASTAASGRYIDWSYISSAVGAQGYLTAETDPTVPAWAKAATKPSYSFSEITGQATAAQVPNIENLTNFSARVYDATISRTKNTVLAAPNGQNGVATFRALVAADLPDLSGMYAAASRVSTLEGYFTNGVAKEAAKLSTVSKTAWGQTYWTSNGVPDSISGNIEAGNNGGGISGFHSIELNNHGSLSDYGGFIDFHFEGSSSDYTSRIIENASGTLSVNSVALWSGYVKATRFYLYKPNADNDTGAVYFQLDNDGNVQLVGAGLWTNSFISALGQNSSGGGGGTGDVTWTALASTAASGRYIDWSYISSAVGAQGYLTAETDPTVPAWAKAATKPSYSFSEITGQATAAQVPNIENLTNFSAQVYDATVSRTKNTVLAAPNGQNGVATFRALVAADLPDLSGMYAAASRVSTLEGYFTNGVANNAARLSTVSKTAWGKTYWTGNGVPDDVSGSIEAGNNGGGISGFHSIELNNHGSLSDYGGFIDFHFNGSSADYTSRIIENASGKLSVNSVALWSGYVQASRFYLYKPNADNDTGAVYFVYDSNGGVQLVGAGLWTNSFISALGQNSSGGGSGGGTGDVTWTALADNTDQRQVAASHLSTALADYLPLSGGTLTGELKVVNSSQAGFHFYTSPNNGAAIIDAYGTSDIEIYGDVYMSSNLDVDGTISQGSDMRRKDVIDEQALLEVGDIANAPAIHFTWKDKADKEHHVGTSAQYWQTLMPEAVHEDKNGYLGMQYDVLAMLGVISVARNVMSHEERIAALEAENERLKKEIEQLKS